MRIIVITSRWEKVVDDWLVGKNLHRLTRIGHSTVSSSHAGSTSTSIYLEYVEPQNKKTYRYTFLCSQNEAKPFDF